MTKSTNRKNWLKDINASNAKLDVLGKKIENLAGESRKLSEDISRKIDNPPTWKSDLKCGEWKDLAKSKLEANVIAKYCSAYKEVLEKEVNKSPFMSFCDPSASVCKSLPEDVLGESDSFDKFIKSVNLKSDTTKENALKKADAFISDLKDQHYQSMYEKVHGL